MRVREVTLPLLVTALTASCQAIFGVEDPGEPGGEDGGGGADVAGPGASGGGEGAGEGGAADAGPAECECVKAEPGWSEPFYLATTAGDAPFECPTPSIVTVYWEGEPAAGHACSGECSCGPVDGVGCDQGSFVCYSGTDCTGDIVGGTQPDGCSAANLNGSSCRVAAGKIAGGTCNGEGGVALKPPWQLAHHRCEVPTPGVCPDGACIAKSGALHELCITAPAGQACPSGWPSSRDVFAGVEDTRACACACSPPQGNCSGGKYMVGTSQFTCGAAYPIASCLKLNGQSWHASWDSGGQNAGVASCASMGAPMPAGDVTGTQPTTLCCRAF